MPDRRVSTELRREVAERARGCCEYCQSQARFSMQSFSVEHIFPREKGGETALENLALACQGCNAHKHTKTEGRDPINKENVTLFHPRHQHWRDHFAWDHTGTLILGLTPIGRATVEALKLNREALVNLRRALRTTGDHPPPDV
ncbi:MAG: HNH endonuclease [Thermoanaerobaculia bacterium]|nr:HNH endonuclease [Thermoanaerobaculia bacterium]